jgi:hypothetical protein
MLSNLCLTQLPTKERGTIRPHLSECNEFESFAKSFLPFACIAPAAHVRLHLRLTMFAAAHPCAGCYHHGQVLETVVFHPWTGGFSKYLEIAIFKCGKR